jgi:hypothetical protein
MENYIRMVKRTKEKPGIREGHTKSGRKPPEAQHALDTRAAEDVMTPNTNYQDARSHQANNLPVASQDDGSWEPYVGGGGGKLPAGPLGSSTYNNQGMVH